MIRKAWKVRRWAWALPGTWLLQSACLPDNAIREVAAENIVRTITLITSSIISTLFGAFFRF